MTVLHGYKSALPGGGVQGRARRRLFINADDFGLTDGVTAGIAEALAAGVVGATTAMVCPDGAVSRIRRWGRSFAGRVGLHLQLTGGAPCLPPGEIPTLVGADGRFPRKKVAVVDVNPDEVRREWRAQYQRFLETGLVPSHLDAHHHIHKRPEAFGVFVSWPGNGACRPGRCPTTCARPWTRPAWPMPTCASRGFLARI